MFSKSLSFVLQSPACCYDVQGVFGGGTLSFPALAANWGLLHLNTRNPVVPSERFIYLFIFVLVCRFYRPIGSGLAGTGWLSSTAALSLFPRRLRGLTVFGAARFCASINTPSFVLGGSELAGEKSDLWGFCF